MKVMQLVQAANLLCVSGSGFLDVTMFYYHTLISKNICIKYIPFTCKNWHIQKKKIHTSHVYHMHCVCCLHSIKQCSLQLRLLSLGQFYQIWQKIAGFSHKIVSFGWNQEKHLFCSFSPISQSAGPIPQHTALQRTLAVSFANPVLH